MRVSPSSKLLDSRIEICDNLGLESCDEGIDFFRKRCVIQDDLIQARQYWDAAAQTFDEQPDHGLQSPPVRGAWRQLLRTWLPEQRGLILDLGCGTGSLSLLLAEMGERVIGADISPAMLDRARAKSRLANDSLGFTVMDAAAPAFPPASFDLLVARHLLWALPDLAQALDRWANLLKPAGRLILIEGFWSTGGGLHAAQILAALPPALSLIATINLSDQPDYWDKPVSDERYAIIAGLRS